MNKWKLLNKIRLLPAHILWLLAYPVRVLCVLIGFTCMVLFTDWEDKWDREYALYTAKEALKFLNPIYFPDL